jgi:uncharacterized protein DUF6894
MGRFYFDFIEQSRVIPDEEGAELPDPEVAAAVALRTLAEVADKKLLALTAEEVSLLQELVAIKVRCDAGPILVARLKVEIEHL